MNKIILKINEIPQQHVGKGRAIIDPKIIEEQNWNIGQILELTFNKKTYVKLWPASPEEYGASLIKIDGITRQNIGAGLDDKISIKSVEVILWLELFTFDDLVSLFCKFGGVMYSKNCGFAATHSIHSAKVKILFSGI